MTLTRRVSLSIPLLVRIRRRAYLSSSAVRLAIAPVSVGAGEPSVGSYRETICSPSTNTAISRRYPRGEQYTIARRQGTQVAHRE